MSSRWHKDCMTNDDWWYMDERRSVFYVVTDEEGAYIRAVFPSEKAAKDYIKAFKDDDEDHCVDDYSVISEVVGLELWVWNSNKPRPKDQDPWIHE